MSFMMMGQDSSQSTENNLVGVSMNGNGMLPISMSPNVYTSDSFATMTATTPAPIIVNNIQPTATSLPVNSTTTSSSTTANNQSTQATMMQPTMTMIFQSEPGGNSAIELNMLGSNMANSTSAALLRRPANNDNRWIPQQYQQQFQQQDDQFDEPVEQQPLGEQYYSSPWTNRAPLASPARLRAQQQPRSIAASSRQQPQQPQQQQQASSQQTSVVVGQVPSSTPNQAQMPILLIKNRWRSQPNGDLNLPVAVLQHQHQQQQPVNQALEYEELVPIGPPQMMPFYQTPNGDLHRFPPPPVMIQPPTPSRVQPEPTRASQSFNSGAQLEREEETSGRAADLDSEVTANNNVEPVIESQRNVKPQSAQSKTSKSKLASPLVKGKQQQQQQQQQKTSPKAASSSRY